MWEFVKLIPLSKSLDFVTTITFDYEADFIFLHLVFLVKMPFMLHHMNSAPSYIVEWTC
jgi:hypothetical protein